MAQTDRKAAPGSPATSPTERADGAGDEAGFTLLELVCVMAIVSIVAAILLPSIPRGTSRARLESYAVEVAALLKADRNLALRRRVQVATEINPMARTVRSSATGRVVAIPEDVAVDATLARRCNQRLAGPTIRFFPSGMSCGGVVVLTRLGVGYEVRVNWLTGGVDVVPITRS